MFQEYLKKLMSEIMLEFIRKFNLFAIISVQIKLSGIEFKF